MGSRPLTEALVVEHHFAQDSSLAQRFGSENFVKVFEPMFEDKRAQWVEKDFVTFQLAELSPAKVNLVIDDQ